MQFFSKDGIYLHDIQVGAPIDGLAVDLTGRICTIHKKLKQMEQWSGAGQLMRTVTGVEPGMKGFSEPEGAAISPTGLVYVVDSDNAQFREMDLTGHTLGVFGRAGSGVGQFKTMDGIAVFNDSVYVIDGKAKRISIFDLLRQSPLAVLAPAPVARVGVSRKTGLPADVDHLAWNPDGTLHALSSARMEVVTYDLTANTTSTLDLKSLGVKNPSGLTTAPSSGALFISDPGNDRVIKMDKKGKLLLEFQSSPIRKALSVPRKAFCL